VTGPVLILGAGRLAGALAAALARTRPVRVWARDADAVRRLAADSAAEVLPGLEALADLEPAPELVLLAVSDRALVDLASRLATVPGLAGVGASFLHGSGYHDVEVLAPLLAAGVDPADLGVLHPSAALAPAAGPEVFAGVTFGVSGGSRGLARATALAQELGGRALVVPPGQRPRYHAAAALLSNGLVALFGEAEATLLGALGPDADPAAVRDLLRRLAASTLHNLEQRPAAEALTGPVARGEAEVVAGQLEALRAAGQGPTAELYTQLVAAMERLLGRGPGLDRDSRGDR
jgi:predicted short-subunit dehydrogenase-like oxidoreductase (DUF2520 family)